MESMRPLAEPHTLAQLGRRAKITTGRARTLYADGRLPRPDDYDADGRPLWSAATIDAWCRTTERTVAEDAAWLYKVPDPIAPAEVLFHGLLEHVSHPGARPFRMFAKCWGTEHGHVVYLKETDDMPSDQWLHFSTQALAAAELIAPRFWPDTLVLVDPGLPYRSDTTDSAPPDVLLQMYRLTDHAADSEPSADEDAALDPPRPESMRERITRLLGRPPASASASAPNPRSTAVRFAGSPDAADVARVIGEPMPTWIRGTCRPAAIDRARAYTTTFTVPDTASVWPQTLARLTAAHEAGLASSHPAGFALLAADAAETLAEARQAHARFPQRGPGWYLVARPAAPTMPLELELELAGLPPLPDLTPDQITTDLADLRRTEAALPAAAPEGDAYEHAVSLLTIATEQVDARLAVDRVLNEAGQMQGEVADQWRESLHRHPNPAEVWSSRRGRRLLDRRDPSEVHELLVDHAGRLVALLPSTSGQGLDFEAEWPVGLPSGWDETTIIAGDHEDGRGYGPVLALTRTSDGLRADLVPAPPDWAVFGGFTWGYGGGGPSTLYDALLRVALDDPLGYGKGFQPPPDSELWEVITTTKGPLRIRWPDLLRWARYDAETGHHTD